MFGLCFAHWRKLFPADPLILFSPSGSAADNKGLGPDKSASHGVHHEEDSPKPSSLTKRSGDTLAAWQRFFSHGSTPPKNKDHDYSRSNGPGRGRSPTGKASRPLTMGRRSGTESLTTANGSQGNSMMDSRPNGTVRSGARSGARPSIEEIQSMSSHRASSEATGTVSDPLSLPTEMSLVDSLHLIHPFLVQSTSQPAKNGNIWRLCLVMLTTAYFSIHPACSLSVSRIIRAQ